MMSGRCVDNEVGDRTTGVTERGLRRDHHSKQAADRQSKTPTTSSAPAAGLLIPRRRLREASRRASERGRAGPCRRRRRSSTATPPGTTAPAVRSLPFPASPLLPPSPSFDSECFSDQWCLSRVCVCRGEEGSREGGPRWQPPPRQRYPFSLPPPLLRRTRPSHGLLFLAPEVGRSVRVPSILERATST
jgi:hypothetical protein